MNQKNLYRDLLTKTKSQLSIIADKSEENAHNTLCALWHTAAGNPVSPIKGDMLELPSLSPAQIIILEKLLNKRLAGTPLAHITERQHFMGIDYILGKGLYIPRKETELLAQTTIELIRSNYAKNKKVVLIDLCCGIGTVALAVGNYCKNTIVYGSDIYKPAITAAKINAKHFGLENISTFFNADMFDPFDSIGLERKTDIIVSAPPYISTVKVKQMAKEISDHEPSEAFDGGMMGLKVFQKLIHEAPRFLRPGGWLCFEVGVGQGEFISKMCEKTQLYQKIQLVSDISGNIRVIIAQK